MDILAECGVAPGTLSSEERSGLQARGFAVFRNALETDLRERLLEAFEAADVGTSSGGTRHVQDLLLADSGFAAALTHARVLAAVDSILGRPFRVLAFSGRDPAPGFGLQGLHLDWMPRTSGSEPFSVVTAIWALDEFRRENGATRVVPGSHAGPRPLPKSMMVPDGHHPDEEVIAMSAGSVLVFNGHVWHGGRRNDSAGPRRAIQCQFVASELIRPDTEKIAAPADAAPHVRRLLGG